MKAIVLAAIASGAVAAKQGPPDDSTARVDLTKFGGPIVYVMCAEATSLSNCESPTFWQENNALDNLQTHPFVTHEKTWAPDSRLLL